VSRAESDPAAWRTWREATDALGTGLASVVALLDPALIVLGGGLANAGSALVGPVRAAIERRLRWREVPEVVTTAVGASAGLIGAALLVTPPAERSAFVRSARKTVVGSGARD
jgi:glucokinase